MEISRAIEILKNKNDYIVPNSDFDEAIAVAISVMEQVTEPEIIMSSFNDAILSDKIIDKFLNKGEK